MASDSYIAMPRSESTKYGVWRLAPFAVSSSTTPSSATFLRSKEMPSSLPTASTFAQYGQPVLTYSVNMKVQYNKRREFRQEPAPLFAGTFFTRPSAYQALRERQEVSALLFPFH